ncbi:hypothetical protein B5F40_12040 [Gordonibacter sp. An230]|nr:hypothetical protein B5F40_12040 [Gordonibacter sp. An230]
MSANDALRRLALCRIWVFALKRDSESVWPPFVAAIFGGLLFFSSFSRGDPLFAASFFRATRERLALFRWVALAGSISGRSLSRLPCFAETTHALPSSVVIATAWGRFLPA